MNGRLPASFINAASAACEGSAKAWAIHQNFQKKPISQVGCKHCWVALFTLIASFLPTAKMTEHLQATIAGLACTLHEDSEESQVEDY